MENIFKINLKTLKTDNKPGSLINIDLDLISKKYNIDFKITNMFYFNDLNNEGSRGDHSNNNIRELIICQSGSFEIKLFDGKNNKTFKINENECIFVPNDIWLSLNNFDNSIILVLCNNIDGKEKKSIYNLEKFKKRTI